MCRRLALLAMLPVKNGGAQKKRSSQKVRGVSREARRGTMVGIFVKEISFEARLKE